MKYVFVVASVILLSSLLPVLADDGLSKNKLVFLEPKYPYFLSASYNVTGNADILNPNLGHPELFAMSVSSHNDGVLTVQIPFFIDQSSPDCIKQTKSLLYANVDNQYYSSKVKYNESSNIVELVIPFKTTSHHVFIEPNMTGDPSEVDLCYPSALHPTLLTPLKQLQNGIAPEDITCNSGLYPLSEPNNKTICASAQTVQKLGPLWNYSLNPTDKIRNSIIMVAANDEQIKNATNGYQLSLSLDNYTVNQKLAQNSEQSQNGSKIYIMADLKEHKDGLTYAWLRTYFDSNTYEKSSQQEINMLKHDTAYNVP